MQTCCRPGSLPAYNRVPKKVYGICQFELSLFHLQLLPVDISPAIVPMCCSRMNPLYFTPTIDLSHPSQTAASSYPDV